MRDSYLEVVESSKMQNFRVFKLIGEFDLNEIIHFENMMTSLLKDGSRYAVLDMSGLEYLDSSGIGCIVRLYRDLEEKLKGKLVLFQINDFVKELFEISNLTGFLTIFNTREEVEKFCSEYKG